MTKYYTKPILKVGDKVEWYEDRYSSFKQYGTIIKINKITARIIDEYGNSGLIPLKDLNWS